MNFLESQSVDFRSLCEFMEDEYTNTKDIYDNPANYNEFLNDSTWEIIFDQLENMANYEKAMFIRNLLRSGINGDIPNIVYLEGHTLGSYLLNILSTGANGFMEIDNMRHPADDDPATTILLVNSNELPCKDEIKEFMSKVLFHDGWSSKSQALAKEDNLILRVSVNFKEEFVRSAIDRQMGVQQLLVLNDEVSADKLDFSLTTYFSNMKYQFILSRSKHLADRFENANAIFDKLNKCIKNMVNLKVIKPVAENAPFTGLGILEIRGLPAVFNDIENYETLLSVSGASRFGEAGGRL
jgi:hypothetical protein